MIMRYVCTLPRFWAVLTLGAVCFSLFYAQAAEEEKDFLEHYYENPRPDEFVAQMKNWAADGTLVNSHARPALIAFISQVVRSNREKVEDWFAELAGLTPEQKQVFFTGLLYSRTKEADSVMTKTFGKQYEEQKVETRKILELPLDKKTTLDMLWGFYYATGSETAIRRIVSCFRFAHAPDDPDGVAFGSLASNAERHPKVVEILETLLKSGAEMTQEEKDGVYDVLSQILPEKYPYIDRTGKGA
jgi:hypothetical protein